MLTQEYLKSIWHYNPETGIFTRIKSTNKKNKPGQIASHINKTTKYICIKINNKIYTAHRLVWLYMYGYFPRECLDHINKIRHDNRLCNLREANIAQNALNKSISPLSTSKLRNVSWCNRNKKWIVRGWIKGKRTYLGSFKCKDEASKHYISIMQKHETENWLFAATSS